MFDVMQPTRLVLGGNAGPEAAVSDYCAGVLARVALALPAPQQLVMSPAMSVGEGPLPVRVPDRILHQLSWGLHIHTTQRQWPRTRRTAAWAAGRVAATILHHPNSTLQGERAR